MSISYVMDNVRRTNTDSKFESRRRIVEWVGYDWASLAAAIMRIALALLS